MSSNENGSQFQENLNSYQEQNQNNEEEEEQQEQYDNLQQQDYNQQKVNNLDDEEIKNQSIADQISEDVEEKLKIFDEYIKGKNEEQTLNIRMHQLALSKILVFTHEKSPFLLVEAHTKLGIAYLNFKCYEQAIDHLTAALKKNGTLFSEVKDSKIYHANILTQLGKCYLEIQSYEDALELLIKANEIQIQILGEDDPQSIQTLSSISNCYSKLKEYDKALEQVQKIWNISETKYGFKSEQCAIVYIDTAKIYDLQSNFNEAIEYQMRSLELLNEIDYNSVNNEFLAEQYQVLANYQEKGNKIQEQIDSLQKVKELYKDIYGQNDKKVIKVKRQISMILLKSSYHEEALSELQEIEEMESKTYGENSVQLAKTIRIIGTIKILTKNYFDAQKYLSRAMKIFEENGMKKAVLEIKEKLKMAKDIKDKKSIQNLKQGIEYD